MTQAQALLVLAHPPVAGRSRMQGGGNVASGIALQLEQALTAQVWAVALQVQARQLAHAWVLIDPPEQAGAHQHWLQGGTGVLPYEGADPEARLLRAFQTLFREGYSRVMLIGTHCVGLSPALLAGAYQALSASEAVIGPTTAGRLWLLGLRQYHRRLLEGLAWDQPRLFDDLVSRGGAHTLSTLILPVQTALESPEDALAILGAPYADRLPPHLIQLLRQAGGLATTAPQIGV